MIIIIIVIVVAYAIQFDDAFALNWTPMIHAAQ